MLRASSPYSAKPDAEAARKVILSCYGLLGGKGNVRAVFGTYAITGADRFGLSTLIYISILNSDARTSSSDTDRFGLSSIGAFGDPEAVTA